MRSSVVLSALALLTLLAVPQAARAQEAQPGDACAVANTLRVSGGPETTGKGFTMTCQGGVWVRITESDTAGNLGVKQAAPKAPLHVGGEAIIGTTTGLPCDADRTDGLRWSSTSSTVEMCDGASWRLLSATPVASDCTPDAFSFTDVADQSLSALILSNTLNITGIDPGCTVSVSGSGFPEFRVNGSTWVTAASINPGDSLQVRQISSNVVSTARIAAVAVGSTTDNWSATTRAGSLKIFETSASYNVTGVGSLANADSLCQAQAGVLGYAGSYKALLSDATTNAKDRLTLSYPIVRATDGTTVVATSNLWSGTLDNSISGVASIVWTGTMGDGTKSGFTCSSWTTTTGGHYHGHGNQTSGAFQSNLSWISDANGASCNGTFALFCVQQ